VIVNTVNIVLLSQLIKR